MRLWTIWPCRSTSPSWSSRSTSKRSRTIDIQRRRLLSWKRFRRGRRQGSEREVLRMSRIPISWRSGKCRSRIRRWLTWSSTLRLSISRLSRALRQSYLILQALCMGLSHPDFGCIDNISIPCKNDQFFRTRYLFMAGSVWHYFLKTNTSNWILWSKMRICVNFLSGF